MRHRIAAFVPMLVLAVAAAACGEPPITAEDEAFALVEAGWQCQVSRRAFSEFDQIGAARVEFVEAAGISMDRYLHGVAQLPDRPSLRDLVAEDFDRICGAG